jgi:hypothetical protein
MRTSWMVPALAVASALLTPTSGTATKPPPCPGGRYLVDGLPLAPGLDGSSLDVVVVAGRVVSILSGCNPVAAKVRATRQGAKIRARWKSCPAFPGKATLSGFITEECRRMSATFIAKSAGILKPFRASLSACGDGIFDPDGGEACDAGDGACGALCTACSCGGVTTTTTPSDGTSTSTTPTMPTTSTTSPALSGPDLAGIDWMSPGSVKAGSNIAVQFSVKNFGNATAVGPWYDYILLSSDYAVGNDTAVAVVQRSSNLSAGSQYTVLVPQVTIPAVPPGTYFLFLHTDGANAVAETDDTNNVGGFVQLTVTP